MAGDRRRGGDVALVQVGLDSLALQQPGNEFRCQGVHSIEPEAKQRVVFGGRFADQRERLGRRGGRFVALGPPAHGRQNAHGARMSWEAALGVELDEEHVSHLGATPRGAEVVLVRGQLLVPRHHEALLFDVKGEPSREVGAARLGASRDADHHAFGGALPPEREARGPDGRRDGDRDQRRALRPPEPSGVRLVLIALGAHLWSVSGLQGRGAAHTFGRREWPQQMEYDQAEERRR